MDRGTASTIAGGGAGLLLLQTVRWELVGVQPGETVKVGIALLLALTGYLMYRKEA
jgi:hypothetical protein